MHPFRLSSVLCPLSSCKLVALFCLLTPVSFLLAAVDGTVTNATTGNPQAGVSLNLVQPGAGGMQTLGTATSDANGKFSINKDAGGRPALIQANYKDVTYTTILQPGAPTSGVSVSVFDTTTRPESAKLSQHVIILEPSADGLQVTEAFILANDSNATYSDPAKGSIQVYIPGEPKNLEATVEGTAGVALKRPLEKTSQAGVYKLSYPVKPGEARFDVSYALAATDAYDGKLLRTDGPTRIIAPSGFLIVSDDLKDLGVEPRTQARIYQVTLEKPGATFKTKITGTGSLQRADDGSQGKKEDDGSPQATVINARIYTQLAWVLGLTFAILALGGTLLYRRGAE